VSAFEQLTTMTRPDLVGRFDHAMQTTIVGADYWREEIFRRDFEEQNRQLLSMTRHIRWLTALVAVLTLVVTVATVVGLAR